MVPMYIRVGLLARSSCSSKSKSHSSTLRMRTERCMAMAVAVRTVAEVNAENAASVDDGGGSFTASSGGVADFDRELDQDVSDAVFCTIQDMVIEPVVVHVAAVEVPSAVRVACSELDQDE